MDFLEEFKRRCELIDKGAWPEKRRIPLRVLTPESFEKYQILKIDGNERSIVFMNLNKADAEQALKLLRARMLRISVPNDVGRPYFKLEAYKIVLGDTNEDIHKNTL
jgi:hypothetical protein